MIMWWLFLIRIILVWFCSEVEKFNRCRVIFCWFFFLCGIMLCGKVCILIWKKKSLFIVWLKILVGIIVCWEFIKLVLSCWKRLFNMLGDLFMMLINWCCCVFILCWISWKKFGNWFVCWKVMGYWVVLKEKWCNFNCICWWWFIWIIWLK